MDNRFNLINCFLILGSLFIAILLPFELFIFSYAVLGPAHYLTEINWLKNQGFYTKNSNHVWVLVAITVVISVSFLLPKDLQLGFGLPERILALLTTHYGSLIFITLILSVGLVYSQNWRVLALLVLLGLCAAYFFRHLRVYQTITLLIPTLIHVYVFTFVFMISGALRTKNRIEIISIILFILGPVMLFFIPNDLSHYQENETIVKNFRDSGFSDLSFSLTRLAVPDGLSQDNFLLSDLGLRIQAFVAFAYTYHYMNWFAKVSIIGWIKNTDRKSLTVIAFLWIGSIALYLIDYKMAVVALFSLSLLHVVLEFPLNVVVFRKLFSN
jgi:hypothetical protein